MENNLCSSDLWEINSSVGEFLSVGTIAQSRIKIIQEVWRCEEKCLYLHKIGGISAIEASFIAFDLHNLCIRLAAARHNIQASLMILLSTCTIFA